MGTSGVYSLCRHPSYLGWFMWSLGENLRRGVYTNCIFRGPISSIPSQHVDRHSWYSGLSWSCHVGTAPGLSSYTCLPQRSGSGVCSFIVCNHSCCAIVKLLSLVILLQSY